MRYGVPRAVVALSAALANPALAAVRITSEAVTAGGKTDEHTIYLTPARVRVDSEGSAIIFRTDTGKMLRLSKDKHEYIEIDPKEIGARVSAVQAQMQQRLQAVPEAQRKQIEAMLAQHGVAGGQPKQQAAGVVYEKTGQTKTVGSWTCQVFHQKRAGDLAADVCIAPAAAVGLTRDDLAALRAISDMIRKSLPDAALHNAALMDFEGQTRQIGFEGIPVESVVYRGGKSQVTTTVKSVDHAQIPADLFEVPAGYTRKEIPGLGRME